MRRCVICFVTTALLAVAIVGPAFAQATGTGTTNTGFNISWSALDPGNDWVAQAIESLFPTSGTPPVNTGHEATVIGRMVGELTGFVSAIAMFFVAYGIIMNIHRTAETSQIMVRGMTTMAVLRIGVAAIMMFPTTTGFSVGQSIVVQAALWGIGMAKTVYTDAVQAIGPDSMIIATPVIPGTKTIVLGLIEDEMCKDLVNQAAANPDLMAEPSPVTINNPTGNGGSVTWSYSLSPGNETGSPACGTVTIASPATNIPAAAGMNTDMAATQQGILSNILNGDIVPGVQAVAQNFWQTKQAAALAPLEGIFVTATNGYTTALTDAATSLTANIQSKISAQAANGNGAAANIAANMAQNSTILSSLGWSGAGAYYLEFARLNGQTLSILNATPNVTPPSYEGLGDAMSSDLAPLIASEKAFLAKMGTLVQTTDGLNPTPANADLFSTKTPSDGMAVLEAMVKTLGLDNLFNKVTTYISPAASQWTDPFARLLALGNWMIMISLIALGVSTVMASGTLTGAASIWQFFSGNAPGALATLTGHLVVQYLAQPILIGTLALLIPGLVLAFVLPMIPYIMWMAGVVGYLILVCEAVIAVPLWMLAHMTFEGDDLHGNAKEGYAMVFDLLFRPTLMLFGLFLSYFIFDSGAWLIQQTFGIATGFVLENGNIVTNLLGCVVILAIYVMLHLVLALTSFRMITLVPYHLPRMIGFSSSNRVDMEQWGKDAALIGTARTLQKVNDALQPVPRKVSAAARSLGTGRTALPGAATPSRMMDSTTVAATQMSDPSASEELDEQSED